MMEANRPMHQVERESRTEPMTESKIPEASGGGLGLPSAVNLPVPPPPPPPPAGGVAGRRPGPAPPDTPAAEAHAFLMAYGPTLLGEAIKRILDASFAVATSPDASEATKEVLSSIQPQSAAMMVAMILMGSGMVLCQSAKGSVSHADIVFLFDSTQPLLTIAGLNQAVPALSASSSAKRRFLESLLLQQEEDWSLSTGTTAALEGFRYLAMYDTLNGCPLSSPGALSVRMRHGLLKYLHTLADCDGQISNEERHCIAYLKQRCSDFIAEGIRFAKATPSAARRLRLSPFARPVLTIERYRPRDSHKSAGAIHDGEPRDAVDQILHELWEMTGLASVKEEIISHINILKVSALRTQVGLSAIKTTNHMVFTGNPGTGKTTVARKLASLYRELGILSVGTLTEVDQSALVAGFVGQTAIKTKEVVEQAKDGVLFIDEAYALTSGMSEDSYGREAIDTLLKYMEDYRDDLIVIVAGYEQPMNVFLASNPGLKSRFNKFIAFPDYDAQELKSIFLDICNASGYVVSTDLDAILTDVFTRMTSAKPPHFGNGRTVRNLFDCAVVRQANRVIQFKEPTHQQLMELSSADLKEEDLKKVLQ